MAKPACANNSFPTWIISVEKESPPIGIVIDCGTEVRENGRNIVQARARLGITEQIEERQLNRRDLRLARIGLALFDSRGDGRHIFSGVEAIFERPARTSRIWRFVTTWNSITA